MDVEIVRKMAKNWGAKFDGSIIHCPATARFITGVPSTDAMFYHFETESGLTLTLTSDCKIITGYSIDDKEKFMWFKLLWA